MRFFEMPADGSTADLVFLGKLGCGLFVPGVVVPEVVRVEACAAVKLPLALVASIALRAVSCPVFLGMF